jgi:hypothetical protein
MFRFTIRDVLWLMVVVALACAWWLSHRSELAMRQQRDSASHRLAKLTNYLERNGVDVIVDEKRVGITRKGRGRVMFAALEELLSKLDNP